MLSHLSRLSHIFLGVLGLQFVFLVCNLFSWFDKKLCSCVSLCSYVLPVSKANYLVSFFDNLWSIHCNLRKKPAQPSSPLEGGRLRGVCVAVCSCLSCLSCLSCQFFIFCGQFTVICVKKLYIPATAGFLTSFARSFLRKFICYFGLNGDKIRLIRKMRLSERKSELVPDPASVSILFKKLHLSVSKSLASSVII